MSTSGPEKGNETMATLPDRRIGGVDGPFMRRPCGRFRVDGTPILRPCPAYWTVSFLHGSIRHSREFASAAKAEAFSATLEGQP